MCCYDCLLSTDRILVPWGGKGGINGAKIVQLNILHRNYSNKLRNRFVLLWVSFVVTSLTFGGFLFVHKMLSLNQ